MTSIVNLFSNFDDLTKPKSLTDGVTKYNTNSNNNTQLISQSLNQGNKFKKDQKKISDSLEKRADNLSGVEGFQSQNTNTTSNIGITEQTTNLLNSTDITSQKQIIMNLQNEYDNTLNQYKDLLAKINGTTTDYLNRVDPNNPYLMKYLHWSDPAANGAIMFVTNQGIAKMVTSSIFNNLLGKNGCPDKKSEVKIDIPWDPSYLVEGTVIPTSPSLIVGTHMKEGESCGNEGANVYVNSLVKNSNATYKGCYADNNSSRTMTFLGGSPPLPNYIQNGDLSQPVKSNNSYEYITSTSKVPGWNFNAVLLNNSNDWGYPIPYPNGNQCVSIQNTGYIEQIINIGSGSYTFNFSACGRTATGANPIDIQLNGTSFYNITPSNTWSKYSTTINITTTGNNTIKIIGKNTSGDKSSAIQNIQLGSTSSSSSNGTYTYDMCKNEAMNSGYKYFALQNVNTETNQGYCAVSNDVITATKNGTGYAVNKVIALWNSQTSGQTGNTVILTDTGSLSVINSSGSAVFNTDNSTASPSNYLGCYGDKSSRAMSLYDKGNQKYSLQQCQDIAKKDSYKYFGLQNSTSGTNAQCTLSNSLSDISKYGKAGNCTKITDGSWSGGGWSNAVYTTDPNSQYFLILQDDGNMVIYRGANPNDNQGVIWSSKTNGKQQKSNPIYAATKGKYSKNWIKSGDTLAPGDFVGSTDGSIYLIMQTDGNLVLYTSQTGENCSKMKDGNIGGGLDGNALYEFTETGFPSNIGKVAYIDGDSLLYPYPESSLGLSNDYNSYTNYSSTGNDIGGASFSNATVDSCKKACNNNKDCYGFDFDKSNKVCYPKNNKMYPKGSKSNNTSIDLYVRTPKITKLPLGVTDKILNIDSISYENYPKSDKDIKNNYNLTKATSVQKQQLEQLQTKIDMLSSQISKYTSQFDSGSQQLEKQAQTNFHEINNYIKDINKTNTKIKGVDSNIDNILKDSDIVVLQKNYDYLFWSIVATATVLISMNVIKNN